MTPSHCSGGSCRLWSERDLPGTAQCWARVNSVLTVAPWESPLPQGVSAMAGGSEGTGSWNQAVCSNSDVLSSTFVAAPAQKVVGALFS